MSQVIYKLGDDISTDIIYPGRYMATVLPTETPQFAFADIKELNEKLNTKQVPHGSIIVGGKNFGCGSSREQAVSALKLTTFRMPLALLGELLNKHEGSGEP